MMNEAVVVPAPSESAGTLPVQERAEQVFDSSMLLDERVSHYCQQLLTLGSLWRQLTLVGFAQGHLVKRVELAVWTLDRVARQLLETTARVESKRQSVIQLTENVAVSGHALEARAQELAEAEQESEYREQRQAHHIMAIHRLQQETHELEKRLWPKANALKEAMDRLADKEERLKGMQILHGVLNECCAQDRAKLDQQAQEARLAIPLWQDNSILDIDSELLKMDLNENKISQVEKEVTTLKNQLHHLQTWGSQALQTKLMYCTRSHQTQQRTLEVEGMLASREHCDSEVTGVEDMPVATDPSVSDSQRATDLLLADGAPAITADQLESYLSQELGFEVRGHYLMFCRLKEELGGVGLAYLAHKICDHGSLSKDAANPSMVPAFADPAELWRVLHVIRDVAFQFRADLSLTESVLRPWAQPAPRTSLPTASHTRLLAKPGKRGKSKNSSGKAALGKVSSKQEALIICTPPDTPSGSKDKVGSRSSLSLLKRAFGISHKKSQHAATT